MTHQLNFPTYLVAVFVYRHIMANPVLATYAPTDPSFGECLYPSFGNVFTISIKTIILPAPLSYTKTRLRLLSSENQGIPPWPEWYITANVNIPVSSVSFPWPWCDVWPSVIWLWDIHCVNWENHMSLKTKGSYMTCMYDSYVQVCSGHIHVVISTLA